ncbi:MAG: hypothetical protein ACOCRX_11785, partial [Candidatus Woesearchaeota archaeon]
MSSILSKISKERIEKIQPLHEYFINEPIAPRINDKKDFHNLLNWATRMDFISEEFHDIIYDFRALMYKAEEEVKRSPFVIGIIEYDKA